MEKVVRVCNLTKSWWVWHSALSLDA